MPAKRKESPAVKPLASNPHARHDYLLEDRFEAGLVLLGTEVKAAREGKANLKEAYVGMRGEEAFLVGCHIGPYSNAGYAAHEPTRARKLLLNRRELKKLHGKLTLRGHTIVPLRLYAKKGRLKLEIALARGRKHHDKREDKGRKEAEREVRQALGRS